jgi:single-strand DNA-binding protein
MAARSLNKVMLIGNLTRDPELRYTPQGTAVCSFGIATNRDWVDQSGQRQEDVTFHNCVAWSKLAEICGQLLKKGRKVYVEGRLSTRTWTGQDSQERRTTEVVIEEMIAFGPGTGGAAHDEEFGSAGDDLMMPTENAGNAGSEDVKPAKKSKKKDVAQEIADDIPF